MLPGGCILSESCMTYRMGFDHEYAIIIPREEIILLAIGSHDEVYP